MPRTFHAMRENDAQIYIAEFVLFPCIVQGCMIVFNHERENRNQTD